MPARLPRRARILPRTRWLAVFSLLVAGCVHLVVALGHAQMSLLFGVGSLGAALAQLLLAALLVRRTGPIPLAATIFVNVALLALYLGNVIVGFPFLAHHGPGPEPIDRDGILAAASEIASIAVATVLLRSRSDC